MFWLPYGWFPYYAEWLLSFPRAPLGSVSIASWQVACAIMIDLISKAIRRTMTLAMKWSQARGKRQAMKVPAEKKGSDEKSAEAETEKRKDKEL
jgi:tail-anchored protein insertion receptor